MTTPKLDEPIDGRTARAVRTRLAIVDACLDLIAEGELRPTAPRIAERAGVSVRSVFQHFDDLDGLFRAVGDRLVVRVAELVHPIDPARPLDERLDSLVAQRSRVSEEITPVMRAALVHASSSQVIHRQFTTGHSFVREMIAEGFAPELSGRDPDGRALLALTVAVSWTTWDVLRRMDGLSFEDAAAQLRWQAEAVLVRIGALP